MFKNIRRAVIAAASALTLGIGGAVWVTSAASAAHATPPACTSGKLAVWVNADQSSGAAGTIAYALDFTNLTGHACRTRGFPGVSLTNARGKRLGDAAGRNHLFKPRWVNIPAHGTAHADLFWSDGEVFTSGCKPTTATLIKVFPPDQRRARTGFFDLKACTLRHHPYLRISVVRPGPNLDA